MNIRLSTQRTVVIGPILDTDGAAKTDEVVASVLASKNGGNPAALDGSATLTHKQTGYYLLLLTATDTNTLGCLEISLNSGTNTMPLVRMNVATAAAWDAMYAASGGYLPADLTYIHGTALTETDGQLAAAFVKMFNVATPTGTVNSLPDAVPGAAGGVFIAGSNAATSITTALTANIVGDITGTLDTVTTCTTTTTNSDMVSIAGLALEASLSDGSVTLHSDYNAAKTAAQAGDLMLADLTKIHGTALTETDGQLAGRFVDFFDQASAGYSVATALSSFKATGFAVSGDPMTLAAGAIVSGSFGAGAITAAAIADAAIDNATFAADVGSTVYATNIIALAVNKALANYGPNTVVPDAAGTVAGLLGALETHGDGTWATGTGTSTLTQGDIRTAVGLAGANLDTQLSGISGYVDCLPIAWVTVPTAAQIKTAMEAAGGNLALIMADTNELQLNQGNWATAVGFATPANVTAAHATTDALIGDVPTVTEFNARTLLAAAYFDPTTDTVVNVTTVGSVTAKTGYSLAATGLDAISAAEPTAKPTTFAGWIMWLVQKARRSKLTATVLTTEKEDGTAITTQAVSDDGTTQQLGAPT